MEAKVRKEMGVKHHRNVIRCMRWSNS